jgi:hypothetical protein
MFSLGHDCRLNVDPIRVPAGTALLMKNNSLRIKEGTNIRIKTKSATLYAKVVELADCYDVSNCDNIAIGVPLSETNGSYKKVSGPTVALHKAWGIKKARLSGLATALSIASATWASLNASMKDCTGLGCVSTGTWILILISACSAIVAWMKDNDVL